MARNLLADQSSNPSEQFQEVLQYLPQAQQAQLQQWSVEVLRGPGRQLSRKGQVRWNIAAALEEVNTRLAPNSQLDATHQSLLEALREFLIRRQATLTELIA